MSLHIEPTEDAVETLRKERRKNYIAALATSILSVVLAGAILYSLTIIIAPMIVPYGYEEILSINGKRDKGAKNLAPFTYSKAEQKFIDEGGTRFPHIMGTDEQCRDYFIRVIYGARISLVIGFFASIIVLIIGMIIGSISGYAGGTVSYTHLRAHET